MLDTPVSKQKLKPPLKQPLLAVERSTNKVEPPWALVKLVNRSQEPAETLVLFMLLHPEG